ncbi:MAG TPA: peptide ABC transporter substrate-binding protein [Nitrolancea sp.]|nr:peptide ABC transporter substrate-binding protein [Nitrolancea sp.]
MLPSSRSLRAALLIFPLLLLIPACVISSSTSTPTPGATAIPNSPTPTSVPLTPTPKPDKGGTLVAALPAEPDTLNFTLSDQPATIDALSVLDSRMIRVRADGQLEPQLLTDVPSQQNGGISADGLTWVLHFRADVEWSDEEPLDGRDFRFTWKTITNPSYPAVSRAGWADISSIALSADYLTATITLARPSGTLINTILAGGGGSTAGFLLPEHLFSDVPVAEIARSSYGDTGHVGSGPFKIAKWSEGDQIVAERNDHFFGPEARLDRIVLRFQSDTRTVMTNLSTGELDLGVGLSETSVVDIRQIQNINAEITPKAGAVEMISLNLDDPSDLSQPHPVLSDLAVRQALIYGFNRQHIVDDFLLGQSSVAITPLDYTQWSDDSLKAYPFDPNKARQLLDDAGWLAQSDGVRAKEGVRLSFRLTIVQGDDPQAILGQRIAKEFVSDMDAIGVQVQELAVPETQLNADAQSGGIIASRSFDAIDLEQDQRTGLLEFDARFNSANIPSTKNPGGRNITGYRSEITDASLNGLQATADPRAQQDLLNTAQRAIYHDLPVIPIYDHFEVDASRSYVNGLKGGPISGLWWNTEEWWINHDEAAP